MSTFSAVEVEGVGFFEAAQLEELRVTKNGKRGSRVRNDMSNQFVRGWEVGSLTSGGEERIVLGQLRKTDEYRRLSDYQIPF